MNYQCGCGRTITLSTYTFLTSSAGALNAICLEGRGYDQGDPFAGSYLQTGDRVLDIIEEEDEDDENEDMVIGDPPRDFSIYDTIEFEE